MAVTGGTATGGGIDYEDPTPDTLVFVQNLASTSFPFVPICDNVTGEGNENVQLTIFVPPQYQHYVATQQPSTTTVIIIDDCRGTTSIVDPIPVNDTVCLLYTSPSPRDS